MKLVWTKSNLILSVLIRWGLNTDCSHFAIVFESPDGGLMFESNLLGTHPKFFKTAQKHMTVVHEIDMPVSVEVEDHVWDIVVDDYDDRDYNFKAFFYFCWRAFLNKVFKIPFPAQTKWSNPNNELCIQIFKALIDAGVLPDLGLDLAIASPHELYLKITEYLQNK